MATFITELRNTFILSPRQELVSKCVIFEKMSFTYLNFNKLSAPLISTRLKTHTHSHKIKHTLFLSLLQILMPTLTITQRKWPSLERQQVIVKELCVCTRPRHQPLISQINYRIATRRHLSAARKWKQKSAPEANSHTKKTTTENRWRGFTMQAKPEPSLFWLSNSQEQQTQLMISFSGSTEPFFSPSEIT